MQFICHAKDACPAASLGGKAGALAALHRLSDLVPCWFVLSPGAFEASLGPEDRRKLNHATGPEDIFPILEKLKPSNTVCVALQAALADLCPGNELVAVRSSATEEDGAHLSFAGQFESFLFVRPQDVAEPVAAVWRSAFSERVLSYRRRHGLPLVPNPPSVIVQRMVNAEAAGVAFGADPVTGRSGRTVVSAVYGLGSMLVSGESDADTWRVDRADQIVQREISCKRLAHRLHLDAGHGVTAVAVPDDDTTRPALSDDQIRAVVALVRRVGRHFGRPQDIEWAIEQGRLYLLQSRPITTLAETADPDAKLNVWDNSNISESYSGVTTPLTFSFARRAYEEVYRQFCRMMVVPKAAIAAQDDIFRQMLGLIRGRVYYNLLNWYRVLALLPGFKVNRRFMEQMMGVKEGLPEELLAGFQSVHWTDRIKDGLNMTVSMGGLLLNLFLLPRRIREFYVRLNAALVPPRPPLEEMRPDELMDCYHGLERQLLMRWDAPLINDFFAMIFFGVLRKLTQRWCGDAEGTLPNDLLCGEGGMISAEPARRVLEMARSVRDQPGLVLLLCEGSLAAISDRIEHHQSFQKLYDQYLETFGDRCLEELKLESATLHDDPLFLLRSVGRLARSGGEQADRPPDPKHNIDLIPVTSSPVSAHVASRLRAEQHVFEALKGHPLKRAVFRLVLRQARARVRDRENLRFERTRLFGRVRRIFVELGRRLHSLDRLEEERDVFYLEVNELLGFVEGTVTTTDLKGLVALRKAQFATWQTGEPPPDRFETRGTVGQATPFQSSRSEVQAIGGNQRKGIGCCPGLVRGAVRVVTDPRLAALRTGEILVAERTDPGWILLFPSAAGLLVERGSLLSHSAIVARELGLPAIVSLVGVTRWLRDGDVVEMDGRTGIVRKIEP